MAFIRIIDTNNFIAESTLSAWVITKSNNEQIFVVTDNPFKTLFNNGYIDITDIFGRRILLNTQLCIEMAEITLTKVEYKDKTEYYEGKVEIRMGYSYSMAESAKPITLKKYQNICG